MTSPFHFGFRILGDTTGPRRLVDAERAFQAYCAADPAAELSSEAYLSSFRYADDFARLLKDTGTVAGFAGACWSPHILWDIDREDPARAIHDARLLVSAIVEGLGLAEDDALVCYSGRRGYHVALPTATWGPAPAVGFHRIARHFAERIAERAGIAVDPAVYSVSQPIRCPNSRHAKSGLYKVRLDVGELMALSPEAVTRKAAEPMAFDPPMPTYRLDKAAALWAEAENTVRQQTEAATERTAGPARLNRKTLEFLTGGAPVGQRHGALFSCAANLAEFGCPPALAHALLGPAGEDCGLPPREVARQIECGLKAGGGE